VCIAAILPSLKEHIMMKPFLQAGRKYKLRNGAIITLDLECKWEKQDSPEESWLYDNTNEHIYCSISTVGHMLYRDLEQLTDFDITEEVQS